MGFFHHPLLRSRFVPLTVALFAALWFALPLLKALAVPPDTGPIQGSATAVQDPPGSCPAQANTIPFAAVISIQNGILLITDPAGGASGMINSNGTAQLTGPQETYDLLSTQGTTLNLREFYAGCTFATTIVLQRVLYQVVPEPTLTSAPTIVVNAPGGVELPASGGQSLWWWWFWGAGIVVGIVLAGGGWWYYYWYEPDREDASPEGSPPGGAVRADVPPDPVAPDCPEERRRVQQALDKLQAMLDYPELRGALGSEVASWVAANNELIDALRALATCLGVDSVTEYTRDLLKRFGFSDIPGRGAPPGPGSGFDPVPPTAPVPPPAGSGAEGEDRQEIG